MKLVEKRILGYKELASIRAAFGIKNIKRNNKIGGFEHA